MAKDINYHGYFFWNQVPRGAPFWDLASQWEWGWSILGWYHHFWRIASCHYPSLLLLISVSFIIKMYNSWWSIFWLFRKMTNIPYSKGAPWVPTEQRLVLDAQQSPEAVEYVTHVAHFGCPKVVLDQWTFSRHDRNIFPDICWRSLGSWGLWISVPELSGWKDIV